MLVLLRRALSSQAELTEPHLGCAWCTCTCFKKRLMMNFNDNIFWKYGSDKYFKIYFKWTSKSTRKNRYYLLLGGHRFNIVHTLRSALTPINFFVYKHFLSCQCFFTFMPPVYPLPPLAVKPKHHPYQATTQRGSQKLGDRINIFYPPLWNRGVRQQWF